MVIQSDSSGYNAIVRPKFVRRSEFHKEAQPLGAAVTPETRPPGHPTWPSPGTDPGSEVFGHPVMCQLYIKYGFTSLDYFM